MNSKKELKVGDVVKYWGFDFLPLKWHEKIYLLPKWWSRDFSYWIKCQYQKVRYGFSREESWDFYSHCAKWSLPRLKHLRKNINGYPCSMMQEADELNSTQQVYFSFIKDVKLNKDPHQKWKDIIDKIIWSMENHGNEPDPIYPTDYKHEQLIVKIDEHGPSYQCVDKRPVDFTPMYKHEERVQEGFELFGKHFRSIWD